MSQTGFSNYLFNSDMLATEMATSASHIFHLKQIYCYLLTLQTAYREPDLFYPQFTHRALISADGSHTYSPSRKIILHLILSGKRKKNKFMVSFWASDFS